jgi:hypothetical protein
MLERAEQEAAATEPSLVTDLPQLQDVVVAAAAEA